MVRTQVALEEDQLARLKRLAEEQSTSMAQLVRHGVELVLEEVERNRRWRRLMEAAGTCRDRSGTTDVAENHDAYLAEIYSRG